MGGSMFEIEGGVKQGDAAARVLVWTSKGIWFGPTRKRIGEPMVTGYMVKGSMGRVDDAIWRLRARAVSQGLIWSGLDV